MKKTMYTLMAMAKDHQGSDCMNLLLKHCALATRIPQTHTNKSWRKWRQLA